MSSKKDKAYVMSTIKSGYSKNILTIIITALFLPLILKSIGLSGFGIISLASTAAGLAVVFEFGLSKSCAYFTARKEFSALRGSLIFTIVYSLLSLILAIVLYIFFKDISLEYDDVTITSLQLLIVIFIVISNICLSFIRGILEGNKKLYQVNLGFIIYAVLNLPGLYLITTFIKNPTYWLLWSFITYSLILIIHLFQSRKILIELLKHKSDFKNFLNYSFKVFSSSLLASGFLPIVRLFVVLFSPNTATLGSIDLAIRFGSMANSFISVLSTPYFAIFSESNNFIKNRSIAFEVMQKCFSLYILGVLSFFIVGNLIVKYISNISVDIFYICLLMVAAMSLNGVTECLYRCNLASNKFFINNFSRFICYVVFLFCVALTHLGLELSFAIFITSSYFLSLLISNLVLLISTAKVSNAY